MRKPLKTILLDVKNETVSTIEVEDNLDSFYEKLDCDLFDIVTRKIGGKYFDVMCDDEGLFNDPKISAIDNYGEIMFVGNLMFFHEDNDGNLVSLSDDDIKHINKYIQKMCTKEFPNGYPMLTQCEY